jgi:hypothetical protein
MTGTAVLDFGSVPADNASVVITGQAGIIAGSFCEAYVQGSSTATNTADDHRFASQHLKLICESIVPGTGFTIRGELDLGLMTGTLNIRWVWV